MASIFKTPSGKYRVKISRKSPDGKYQQITKSGFRTKVEAKAWGAEQEAKKLDSHYAEYTNSLLADYFEKWYKTYKSDKEAATVYQYESTHRYIKKYLKNARMNTFTRTDFQRAINKYGKDHARETVAKRKSHISQCFADAYADGVIEKNPAVRITVTGTDGKDKELKFLEEDDFIKLDDYCKTRLMHKSYLAIYIAMHTGMRYGEIMALTSDDIDFENKTITISKSVGYLKQIKSAKTDASKRIIRVDDDLLKSLSGFNGRIIDVSDNGIKKSLNHALEAIDGKPITFHGLRHSHASLLLRRGLSINYVSERLGHSNTGVTQRVYAHLLSNQRKEEENKISDLFDSFD